MEKEEELAVVCCSISRDAYVLFVVTSKHVKLPLRHIYMQRKHCKEDIDRHI